MKHIVLLVFALIGLILTVWSFKQVLRVMIALVGYAHSYPQSNKPTSSLVEASRKYLRLYFLLMLSGIALIILCFLWIR